MTKDKRITNTQFPSAEWPREQWAFVNHQWRRKIAAPECARPRAQQYPNAQDLMISRVRCAVRSLLRPGTGALRPGAYAPLAQPLRDLHEFRRLLYSISGVLVLVLLFSGLSAFADETAGWGTDLTNALQNARSKQHAVLIEFSAPWCPYCRQMENKTFKDQQVTDSFKQFERVSVNIDHNASLAAQHGVTGIPAFVMLDPEGDEIAKTSGFMEAAPFRQWLADGITNLTATAAQKEEFESRSNEVATTLTSADAATRAKGLDMVLDCCERREKIYRVFGIEKLQGIARSEPDLLLDGLNHPALMARIRVANLLRDKLGQQFDVDPWESANVRQQGVQKWRGRLQAERDENNSHQSPSAK